MRRTLKKAHVLRRRSWPRREIHDARHLAFRPRRCDTKRRRSTRGVIFARPCGVPMHVFSMPFTSDSLQTLPSRLVPIHARADASLARASSSHASCMFRGPPPRHRGSFFSKGRPGRGLARGHGRSACSAIGAGWAVLRHDFVRRSHPSASCFESGVCRRARIRHDVHVRPFRRNSERSHIVHLGEKKLPARDEGTSLDGLFLSLRPRRGVGKEGLKGTLGDRTGISSVGNRGSIRFKRRKARDEGRTLGDGRGVALAWRRWRWRIHRNRKPRNAAEDEIRIQAAKSGSKGARTSQVDAMCTRRRTTRRAHRVRWRRNTLQQDRGARSTREEERAEQHEARTKH